MEKKDADYIWNLMPDWVKEQPKGLNPTFYGTGSSEGDKKVHDKVKQILYGKEESK